MRHPRTTLLGIGIFIALGATGCATKQEVAELRAQSAELTTRNAALRDSLVILWRATEAVVREIVAQDTVPPPRCPPKCWVAAKSFPAAP